MSTVIVKRPPRVHPPQVPSGEIRLEPPPELGRARGGANSAMMQVLPALASVGSVAFFFMPGSNIMMKLMGGMTLVTSLGMATNQMVQGKKGGKGKAADARRDYLRYLSQMRTQVRKTQDQQYAAQMWSHPAPSHLWAIVTSGQRLWERRPTDPDFGQVRLGFGAQRLATPLVAPDTAPVDELEPICADALRRFIKVQGNLKALPLAVSFRSFWNVLIAPGARGTAEDARAEARGVIAQLVTFHAPDEMRICVIAAENRRHHWEWVKWLPHAQHPKETDAAGSMRLVFSDATELEEALGSDLAERPRFSRDAAPLYDHPHIVVIIDGARASGDSSLLHGDGMVGVTTIEIDADGHAGVVRGGLHLTVEGEELHLETGGGASFHGFSDRLSIPQAEALARQLAPLRVGGKGEGDEPLLSALDFTDLMSIGDPGQFDTARGWRRLSPQDRLRVPIGVGENGEPVIIDIKEAALGGMGPHGLCIGATGSGKSEVLRTLVLALAVTHSSESLNFVLSDFKGGATFAGMAEMPHTAAVITNLADDLTMVDRMRDAIVGEMNRRQEMLRDGGNFKNIHDYEKARAAGSALTPMPNLVIVLDEFSEMLTAKPEFLDLFIQIGRIGRSLGVHLLLASQRLEEGKLRGLDTYLSYRLGLKTFSAAESRVVLGVPDAFTLPAVPGSGYLKTVGQEGGNPAGIRFKAAYVSGTYKPQTRAVEGRKLDHRRPALFTSNYQIPPRVEDPVDELPAHRGGDDDDVLADTVLDVLVRQMEGQGPPAHQVWLPPLIDPPTLDQLMPGLQTTAQRGLTAPDFPGLGRLVVPIAIADKPIEQKREVYQLDLSSAAGHAVIVGGPRSGKSTLVRTVLTGLALGHTPSEVQFFCLDFGGGSLMSLSGLPHMSGLGTRLDADVVRRLVSEVVALVDKREESFRRNAIDSIGTFRARRARGELPDEPFGDVFLVIDGWQTVRSDFDMLEADIVDVTQRGLGFGVHVILTASRWPEIKPALKDAINTRVELRLGDPMESDIDRRVAANVPAGTPGRGLTKAKLHFLAALPRIDGVESAADLADGVAKTVSAIADGWHGPAAPKLRMLPTMVDVRELPPVTARPGQVVPLGVDETKLEPVYLDFNADPHFLMFGEGESGKTSVLRTIIKGISEAYTPQQARMLVVDYRRTLLGQIPDSHLLSYCAAQQGVVKDLGEIKPYLVSRQPGPDVTQEQLRNRSWWTGPEIFVIVDDYDLVATQGNNPLMPLSEFIPMARDLGLHVIISRASGGASRALFEPLIQRLRESRQPGLMLSGEREEGQLIGQVRPSQQPPGRGTLVSRKHGTTLVQTAYSQPLS